MKSPQSRNAIAKEKPFKTDTVIYLVCQGRVQVIYFGAGARVGHTFCWLPWEQVLEAFNPSNTCSIRVRVAEE